MTSKNLQPNSDGGNDAIDWAILVQRIQERMYLAQQDIADRCGVARQTVSAWLHGRRKPGLYAKRELVMLAAEAGVLDEIFPVTEPGQADNAREAAGDWIFRSKSRTGRGNELTAARQLRVLLKQLSADGREEVLEFARFKIFRERG